MSHPKNLQEKNRLMLALMVFTSILLFLLTFVRMG